MMVRVYLGSVLLLLVAGSVWTQRQAWQYGYGPALGTPWKQVTMFRVTYRVYAPWKGPQWWWQWQASARAKVGVSIGILLGGLGLGIAGIRGLWGRGTAPPAMEGHGTARWATIQDIRKAKLW